MLARMAAGAATQAANPTRRLGLTQSARSARNRSNAASPAFEEGEKSPSAFRPNCLPNVRPGFSDVRLVLNGVIIVLAVLFLPGGLLGVRMRRRAA